MDMVIAGSNPLSYVIKTYLEKKKGIPTSVVGKASRGPIRFFFWVDKDEDKDLVRRTFQDIGLPYSEHPFPAAVLHEGELKTELTPEIEDAYYRKTNTDIQFVGEDIINFLISTPESPSEWILDEAEEIKRNEDGEGWKIKISGIYLDAERLAATKPLPILGRSLGTRIKVSRIYIKRRPALDNLPFDPKVHYRVVWDVDTEGVYRWVLHGGEWFEETFSFKREDWNSGVPHIRHPMRLTSYSGIKLYGPFAQWNPKANLPSVLKRLEAEY